MTSLDSRPDAGDDERTSVKNWVTCPYCGDTDVDIEIWAGETVVFNCDQCRHTGTFSVREGAGSSSDP